MTIPNEFSYKHQRKSYSRSQCKARTAEEASTKFPNASEATILCSAKGFAGTYMIFMYGRINLLHFSSRFVQCHPCLSDPMTEKVWLFGFHCLEVQIVLTHPCSCELDCSYTNRKKSLGTSIPHHRSHCCCYCVLPERKTICLNPVHTLMPRIGIDLHFPISFDLL